MNLSKLLVKYQSSFHKVVEFDFGKKSFHIFDFSNTNINLQKINVGNPDELRSFVENELKAGGNSFGVGLYNEDRKIYDDKQIFASNENRSVHLGIDLWTNENTKVFAPLGGIVHSFKNNNNIGDYGPTIILQHQLEGRTFYTLYGHLSQDSITNIKLGQRIEAGELLARIGKYPFNGCWSPHLHFQIIDNIGESFGDYPGVCSISKRELYLENCPDPNLILQLPLQF